MTVTESDIKIIKKKILTIQQYSVNRYKLSCFFNVILLVIPIKVFILEINICLVIFGSFQPQNMFFFILYYHKWVK